MTERERPNLAHQLPGAILDVKEGSLVQERTTRTGIYVKDHKKALLGNVDIFEVIHLIIHSFGRLLTQLVV